MRRPVQLFESNINKKKRIQITRLSLSDDEKISRDLPFTPTGDRGACLSAQDYYPFGMGQPGRSVNVGGYRYGFNGQERSGEINGNSYGAEFWEYDSRIGRRWNLDPSPVNGISAYSAFLNNPNLFKDRLGDTSKFFGGDGVFLYQNNKGKTMNLFVVARDQFNTLKSKFKNKDRLTSELVKVNLKAFDNQDDAAADWSPGGHDATQGDNTERAAHIFGAKAYGDPRVSVLYLVGTTVKGHKAAQRGVSQETDPSGSTVTLNGTDISMYRSNVILTYRKGKVIVSQKQVTYQTWHVTAMVHTHNSGRDNFSISSAPFEEGHGGDYGIAADGTTVYLVPTTAFGNAYMMFRLDLDSTDKNIYIHDTYEGEAYMSKYQKFIYLDKGKVIPPPKLE